MACGCASGGQDAASLHGSNVDNEPSGGDDAEREAFRVNATTIKIADIDLELFEAGAGPPLLFLHSGHGYDPWQSFASRLAAKRRVIAPSHPGFGKSSLPFWLDSIDDIVHVYLEFLDRVGSDRVDLVACSIGGWIAAELATKVPQRFRRLVLVGPAGVKLGPADKLDIPDLFAHPQSDIDKLLYHDPARMTPDLGTLADDELTTVFRNRETLALLVWEPWMHNPKLKHRLHRVTAPALFVRGASDGVISADYLEGYARLLPNARTLTIADAGHLPHLEQPEALAAAINNFLEA
jgi:pimeloyl-ACP methyl ester carboxylesterase